MLKKSLVTVAILYLSFCFQMQVSNASTADSKANYKVFLPSINPMEKVQKTLDIALENKQLALLVLGANWCHDSTGLVRNFDSADMQKILSKHYQILFIDVGNLEDRREITKRFGQVHYFATPTVYIVDPKSEQLLNASTLKKWAMADNVPLKEYKRYFSDYATTFKDDIKPIGPGYQAQINMFAQFQAHRLNLAYNHLRPMMIEEDNGGSPEGFHEDWNAVKAFRIKLQNDLLFLEEQARKSTPLPLKLPSYQPFYWE